MTAYHVVWALSEYFFFLFIEFYILTTFVHRFSNVPKQWLHCRLGPGIIALRTTANTATSPHQATSSKQQQWMRARDRHVFFFFFL